MSLSNKNIGIGSTSPTSQRRTDEREEQTTQRNASKKHHHAAELNSYGGVFFESNGERIHVSQLQEKRGPGLS